MLVGVGLGEEEGEGGEGDGAVQEVVVLPVLRMTKLRRWRGSGKMRTRLPVRITIGGISGLGRWREVGSWHETRSDAGILVGRSYRCTTTYTFRHCPKVSTSHPLHKATYVRYLQSSTTNDRSRKHNCPCPSSSRGRAGRCRSRKYPSGGRAWCTRWGSNPLISSEHLDVQRESKTYIDEPSNMALDGGAAQEQVDLIVAVACYPQSARCHFSKRCMSMAYRNVSDTR